MEKQLKPILGGTKPFRVNQGKLEITDGINSDPVLNNMNATIADILLRNKDKLLSEEVILEYLNSLGLSKILNQYLRNRYNGYSYPRLVTNLNVLDPNVGDVAILYDETTGFDGVSVNTNSGEIKISLDDDKLPINELVITNSRTGLLTGEYSDTLINKFESRSIQTFIDNDKYYYRIGATSARIFDSITSEDDDYQDRLDLIYQAQNSIATDLESVKARFYAVKYRPALAFSATLIVNNVINDNTGSTIYPVTNNSELNNILKSLYIPTSLIPKSELDQVNKVELYLAIPHLTSFDWMVGLKLYVNNEPVDGQLIEYFFKESEALLTNSEVVELYNGVKFRLDFSNELRLNDITSATTLLRRNNVSDYISFDHLVKPDGTKSDELVSLDNIYYGYDQLFYIDDAKILDDPSITTTPQELKYGVSNDELNYSRLVKLGATIELMIQYNLSNSIRIVKTYINLDANSLESTQGNIIVHNSIKSMIFDKRLNKDIMMIEFSPSNLLIYSLDENLTEYRILAARLL